MAAGLFMPASDGYKGANPTAPCLPGGALPPRATLKNRALFMAPRKSSIDQDLIRDLASLLKETDLTEIEVEQDSLRIRVARVSSMQTVSVAAPVHHVTPQAAVHSDAVAAPEAKAADPAKHPGVVPSPMVGTAYYSPAPGANPFVTVGQTVKAGQTVMIVEAMKTMNQIAAPRSGTVSAILVEDGKPVEYGEPLLIIE
jgi:acetyl-CoA carboxylase biotin carboxyl carrier protein